MTCSTKLLKWPSMPSTRPTRLHYNTKPRTNTVSRLSKSKRTLTSTHLKLRILSTWRKSQSSRLETCSQWLLEKDQELVPPHKSFQRVSTLPSVLQLSRSPKLSRRQPLVWSSPLLHKMKKYFPLHNHKNSQLHAHKQLGNLLNKIGLKLSHQKSSLVSLKSRHHL